MAGETPPEAATAEVVLRDGSKQLVTVEFAETYPGLAPDEETLELLDANLGTDSEGIGLGNFKRLKVPSADLNSWMVTRGGVDTAVQEIVGVIVAWKKRRSFWLSGLDPRNSPDGSPPDCASVDNRVPVPGSLFALDGERANQNPNGKCATCPMAARGSDPKSVRGSACRQQMLLFLIVPGSLFPVVIHVPRTSLNNATEYMLDLMDARRKYWSVEVGLSLTKDKSSGGQDYNKIKFRTVRDLTGGEATAANAYGEQIRTMVEEFNASFVEGAEDAESGISVGEPVAG